MLAMLVGCGLRRGELLALQVESIQWGKEMTPKVLWEIVREAASRAEAALRRQ